jgi:hypothetical protein
MEHVKIDTFINVDTNSSYYSMTTCFDLITIILRRTVGIKMYTYSNYVKLGVSWIEISWLHILLTDIACII